MQDSDDASVMREEIVTHYKTLTGNAVFARQHPSAVMPQRPQRSAGPAVLAVYPHFRHKEVQHLRISIVEAMHAPKHWAAAKLLSISYEFINCISRVAFRCGHNGTNLS